MIGPIPAFLSAASGLAVGFTLGLMGGGGSILATPLLLYGVGLSPHLAIGTSALTVSINALANFRVHLRAGTVVWRPAILFAAAGTLGAAIGSRVGERFDGTRLLGLFALLMIAVGIFVLRGGVGAVRSRGGGTAALIGAALAVGGLSGFFGIGGGFLIVPGLIAATGMPMISAIGSSLLSVASFGLATAVTYAAAGQVDWAVAALFLAGGLAGGRAGARAALALAPRRAALNRIFAVIVILVALYMLHRVGWWAGFVRLDRSI